MHLFFDRIRSILRTDILKSLYINFRLLPIHQAVHLPIIVSYATTIGVLSGKITINTKCKPGLIRLGFLHSDLLSWKKNTSFISIEGELIIMGWSQFGVGYSLNVQKKAVLILGNNCSFGSNGPIVSCNKIEIGNNYRAAWDVQIFDTNFH